VLDLNPDVIGITESWTHNNIEDAELMLHGYQLFRCDRNTGNKGGGVLLIVKDVFNPIEFHTKTTYGEHVWCKVGDLLTGVCYRSENTIIVGHDNEVQVMKLLREVSNSHVLIMGDFNYPDIDWSTCTNTSACASTVDFLLTVDDCFLSQHVQAPTRGNAVLDLIMSRYPDLVSDVQILHPLGSSDHNMILFSVHTKCDIDNNKKEIRDYNNADFDRMRTVLADTDWDDMMLGSVNDSWIRFREVLHNLVVDSVPLKVISSKTKLQKPIWMTHKAFKLVVKKRKKFTRYKDSQHPAVKAASKAAKAELRKSRRNFERKLAQNIKQDNKSFFAYG